MIDMKTYKNFFPAQIRVFTLLPEKWQRKILENTYSGWSKKDVIFDLKIKCFLYTFVLYSQILYFKTKFLLIVNEI